MFLVYIVASLVLFGFAMYAQTKVKSSFARYSRVRASSGLTGAQAAMEMLRRAGVTNVRVERVPGELSDHYDPRTRVIRLSEPVFDQTSVAALGVACHEAGHALQHANQYAPLMIRNMAVPAANFGSTGGILIIMAGLALSAFTGNQPLGLGIAIFGLVAFGATVAFQLVNLPVEYDASARAKKVLVETGMVSRGAEQKGLDEVLDAAALTYLAATLSAVVTFLYYAFIVFSQMNNRR